MTDIDKSMTIDGELAKELAEVFDWPAKLPVFTFTREYGRLFGSYDAGFEYNKDGHTFSWDWEITNPIHTITKIKKNKNGSK